MRILTLMGFMMAVIKRFLLRSSVESNWVLFVGQKRVIFWGRLSYKSTIIGQPWPYTIRNDINCSNFQSSKRKWRQFPARNSLFCFEINAWQYARVHTCIRYRNLGVFVCSTARQIQWLIWGIKLVIVQVGLELWHQDIAASTEVFPMLSAVSAKTGHSSTDYRIAAFKVIPLRHSLS